jgi:hypothetical protein
VALAVHWLDSHDGEGLGAAARRGLKEGVGADEESEISWSHEKNLKPALSGPRRRAPHQLWFGQSSEPLAMWRIM